MDSELEKNIETQRKKRKFLVSIPSEYFPAFRIPKGYKRKYFDFLIVQARTRAEAAETAWKMKGKRWLELMKPRPQKQPRIICLEVAVCGLYLSPGYEPYKVQVYHEGVSAEESIPS